MCSITGAMATGIMNKNGSHENCGNLKWVMLCGGANQDALPTAEKSTSPIIHATI